MVTRGWAFASIYRRHFRSLHNVFPDGDIIGELERLKIQKKIGEVRYTARVGECGVLMTTSMVILTHNHPRDTFPAHVLPSLLVMLQSII